MAGALATALQMEIKRGLCQHWCLQNAFWGGIHPGSGVCSPKHVSARAAAPTAEASCGVPLLRVWFLANARPGPTDRRGAPLRTRDGDPNPESDGLCGTRVRRAGCPACAGLVWVGRLSQPIRPESLRPMHSSRRHLPHQPRPPRPLPLRASPASTWRPSSH